MRCAFCAAEVERTLADYIAVIDGECPSSCDDAFVIKISCPICGKVLFAKTIPQEYATWREWPSFVRVVRADDCTTLGADYEENYFLSREGEEVVIRTPDGEVLLRIWGNKNLLR